MLCQGMFFWTIPCIIFAVYSENVCILCNNTQYAISWNLIAGYYYQLQGKYPLQSDIVYMTCVRISIVLPDDERLTQSVRQGSVVILYGLATEIDID